MSFFRVHFHILSHPHVKTRKPSCRWQTRATRKHAKNCSNLTCLQRCRWQYWSICIRLAVVASEITRNSVKIQTYSSRSSKVIDLGANRKRVCTFMIPTNSDFGRISYRFRDIELTHLARKQLVLSPLPCLTPHSVASIPIEGGRNLRPPLKNEGENQIMHFNSISSHDTLLAHWIFIARQHIAHMLSALSRPSVWPSVTR